VIRLDGVLGARYNRDEDRGEASHMSSTSAQGVHSRIDRKLCVACTGEIAL
jgi:hypothetical protein